MKHALAFLFFLDGNHGGFLVITCMDSHSVNGEWGEGEGEASHSSGVIEHKVL